VKNDEKNAGTKTRKHDETYKKNKIRWKKNNEK